MQALLGDLCARVLSTPALASQHAGEPCPRVADTSEGEQHVQAEDAAPPHATVATLAVRPNSTDDPNPPLHAAAPRDGQDELEATRRAGVGDAAAVRLEPLAHVIEGRPGEGRSASPASIAGQAAGRVAGEVDTCGHGGAAGAGGSARRLALPLETEDTTSLTEASQRERFCRVLRQALAAAQKAVKCGHIYFDRSMAALEPRSLRRTLARYQQPAVCCLALFVLLHDVDMDVLD